LYKQYLIQNIVNFKVSLNREKLKTTFKIASWFLLVITLLIANGCTNQKNTTVTRAYHNITSRYNVMFNGKEALKEGRQNIYEGIEDDFTEILPVFPHSDENAILQFSLGAAIISLIYGIMLLIRQLRKKQVMLS